MWYITDTNEHMDSRGFNNLTLIINTIIKDDEKAVIRYINNNTDPDAYLFTDIDLPYIGSVKVGELTVAYAKYIEAYEALVLAISVEIAEQIKDCYEGRPYQFNNYLITKD